MTAHEKAEVSEALDLLSEYLRRHPEMRVGQVISNLSIRSAVNEGRHSDPFYMTNAQLIEVLRSELKK